eukprot:6207566-Pleurochrysis_carterae.AAC.1
MKDCWDASNEASMQNGLCCDLCVGHDLCYVSYVAHCNACSLDRGFAIILLSSELCALKSDRTTFSMFGTQPLGRRPVDNFVDRAIRAVYDA